MEKILLRNVDKPNSQRISTYLDSGGYGAWRKALKQMTPEEVTAEVTKSGLRGRGGAGFPTGRKWSFVPKESPKPKYLVCNADESEPGTFKDRLLIEKDPHMVIEGIAISSYAIGAHTAYIYIRGEFPYGAKVLEKAIAEAYEQKFLGRNILGSGYSLDIYVHRGAGAYICGEETALLESLEGKRGWPRIRPPFPAVVGLFKCPTIVNNVETLANVPHIVLNGGAWYAKIGRDERNTGPKLYCLSGHVKRPGVYEFPLGVNLKELIYDHGGGILGGRELKAVIPGGSSSSVLTADEIDVPADFDSLAKAGSSLGSAGIIVMDETTCLVDATLNLAKFYAHESCGQCTPCREGTGWVVKVLRRIEHGFGRPEDLDLLLDICGSNMIATTICPLWDGAVLPVRSAIRKFRQEFEDHIRQGKCTRPQEKRIRVNERANA